MIFEGLSGFPITPLKNGEVNYTSLASIRDHIDQAGLDSISVLGSTGSFAYLSEQHRNRVMESWSKASTPWIAGVSAITTKEAIRYCNVARENGAQGVIANAFAYVPLNEGEIIKYFIEIADHSPLPLCVYDNPVTTGQKISDDVLRTLSAHENIKATKVFAQSNNNAQHLKLSAMNWRPGYAVDALCCDAMINGASTWYSTLAGTAPELVVPIVSAIKNKDYEKARELNSQNEALYQLMKAHSGYRLMHALANQRGWTCELPSPLILPDLVELSYFL